MSEDQNQPLLPQWGRGGEGSLVEVTLGGNAVTLTERKPPRASQTFAVNSVVGLDLKEPRRLDEGFLQLAIAAGEGDVLIRIAYFGRRQAGEFRRLAKEIRASRADMPDVRSAVEAASAVRRTKEAAGAAARAATLAAALAALPPRHPDDREIASCTVIGGYGTSLPIRTSGRLRCSQAGVDFVAESGLIWMRPYAGLVDVEIGGPGTERTGGGFIGGGFGVTGAAEGMIVAGILNALTTTTQTNSLIALTALDSALILHTSALAPGDLRIILSPLIARVATAKYVATRSPAAPNPDPRDRLEHLTQLKETGAITEEEYQTARQRILDEI